MSGVEKIGIGKVRLHADRDVRPEAAVEVVAMQRPPQVSRRAGAEPRRDLHAHISKPEPTKRKTEGGSPPCGVKVRPFRASAWSCSRSCRDHLTSVRMRVLEWLVVLVALAALYGAIQQIKETTAEDPFLFLRLFTTSRDPLPSFVSFISFLVPLMAIGLGFDAVNGEYNRRTLSRILAQPIYRDALLFGKFHRRAC